MDIKTSMDDFSQYQPNQQKEIWKENLKAVLPDKVEFSQGDLVAHSRDEGTALVSLPGAVVYAHSEQDVLETLAVARQYSVPVTSWGAGTSLEGAVLPEQGAISLDLSGMNEIGQPDSVAMSVMVGPGVRRVALNQSLRSHGLFFPVDPGANASLGGMAATNASGTTTVRYGGMRENVMAMRVVLADGRVLQVGSKARKSSSGYALKPLFIGSEGTLGVITALTLRLYPLPLATVSIQVAFPDLAAAIETSVYSQSMGLLLERVELIDAQTVVCLNRYHQRSDPARPMLWIEVAGRDQTDALAQLVLLEEACKANGGKVVGQATIPEERTQLWAARHSVYDALRVAAPGHHYKVTDLCVPLSQLEVMVQFVQNILQQFQLDAPLVGHIGDGNIHVLMHALPDDQQTWLSIEKASDLMTEEALRLGGTCTGEHGIGLRKREYLRAEHGVGLDVMKDLKQLFDPLGLLNPGKVVGHK